ncbi:hypothetical protein LCGC14_2318770 [marine sediment metagenome]|uniref:Peptidoglycan binding-like domain-containing protein n=1 Tax=marine sediment metagenome TaxID=412755 RepID=A0A0F9CJ06_9ZZZZ
MFAHQEKKLVDYNKALLEAGLVDGRKTLTRHNTKRWDRRNPSKIIGVVMHQSLDNYGTASGIAKYHAGPNHISDLGLPGLSYTVFGEKDGTLILANDVEAMTYSQGTRSLPGDENELYLAICFGGNFPGPGYNGPQEPTDAQLSSAVAFWDIVQEIWGFTNNQLFGHYEFGKPSCPGYALSGIIESINANQDWKDGKFDLSRISGKQEALSELGYYYYEIDGEWGYQSRYALTKFQREYGLVDDGVWGKKTALAILKAL